MVKLSIDFGGKKAGSIVLKRITARMLPNIRRGLRESGRIVAKQIKGHLRTYERSSDPSRRFPSFRKGGLFRSVFSRPINTAAGPGQIVGPNVAYAAIQEFGGRAGRRYAATIPPRPYVWPAWEKRKDDVLNEISKAVMRG